MNNKWAIPMLILVSSCTVVPTEGVVLTARIPREITELPGSVKSELLATLQHCEKAIKEEEYLERLDDLVSPYWSDVSNQVEENGSFFIEVSSNEWLEGANGSFYVALSDFSFGFWQEEVTDTVELSLDNLKRFALSDTLVDSIRTGYSCDYKTENLMYSFNVPLYVILVDELKEAGGKTENSASFQLFSETTSLIKVSEFPNQNGGYLYDVCRSLPGGGALNLSCTLHRSEERISSSIIPSVDERASMLDIRDFLGKRIGWMMQKLAEVPP